LNLLTVQSWYGQETAYDTQTTELSFHLFVASQLSYIHQNANPFQAVKTFSRQATRRFGPAGGR
jgi:hypothetical protein